MSGSSIVPKHKINNISANNKAMLVKLGISIVLKEIHHMVHILMMLWHTLGSRSILCRTAIPVFHLFQASSALKTFMGRSSAMGTLCMFVIG